MRFKNIYLTSAILLGFFIQSNSLWAICGKSLDPKKVVLFVDTNGGSLEAEAAEKAACERGEEFRVIPAPIAVLKKVLAIKRTRDNLQMEYNKCKKNPSCDKELAKTKYKEAEKKYFRMADEIPRISKSLIEDEVDKLAKENKAITSLILSGHDGGGKIHGALGEINRGEILSTLKDSYKNKQGLLKQLHSVFTRLSSFL